MSSHLDFFPPHLQDNNTCAGLAKAIDYLMDDLTYIDGAISLPVVPGTHYPFNLDIQKFNYYMTLAAGTIAENVLDELAYQWNITGYNFADTYARKLSFVQDVLSLHRKKGTPYAIDQILTKFGYTSIVVTENRSLPLLYDGTFLYDNTITYSENLDNQLFDVDFTSTTDLLRIEGDGSGQLSNFSFTDDYYLNYDSIGKFRWEFVDIAGTKYFDVYDSSGTIGLASGSRVGNGVLTFSAVAGSHVNGQVTVTGAILDNDAANYINFVDEIQAISLINGYKNYRPELYELTITEPTNPGGRAIIVKKFDL